MQIFFFSRDLSDIIENGTLQSGKTSSIEHVG